MSGRLALLAVMLLTGGCASLGRSDAGPTPVGRADDRPLEFRQPALFVVITADAGAVDEHERQNLPESYEGALLEALNAKAIVVRDLGRLTSKEGADGRAALARAREIGADAAIIVQVRVALELVTVCGDTRRPLRGRALVVRQDVQVLRASDGTTRLRLVDSPSLEANDVDVDCDEPRQAKRLGLRAAMEAAVAKLARRLFGA